MKQHRQANLCNFFFFAAHHNPHPSPWLLWQSISFLLFPRGFFFYDNMTKERCFLNSKDDVELPSFLMDSSGPSRRRGPLPSGHSSAALDSVIKTPPRSAPDERRSSVSKPAVTSETPKSRSATAIDAPQQSPQPQRRALEVEDDDEPAKPEPSKKRNYATLSKQEK
jgi:hypothetical protein